MENRNSTVSMRCKAILISLVASILIGEPHTVTSSKALAIRFDQYSIARSHIPVSNHVSNATIGELTVIHNEHLSVPTEGSPQSPPADSLGVLGACLLALEQDMLQRKSLLQVASMAWIFLSSAVHAFAQRCLYHSVNLSSHSYNDIVVPSVNLAIRVVSGAWFGYRATRLTIAMCRFVAADCYGIARVATFNRLWAPLTRSKPRCNHRCSGPTVCMWWLVATRLPTSVYAMQASGVASVAAAATAATVAAAAGSSSAAAVTTGVLAGAACAIGVYGPPPRPFVINGAPTHRQSTLVGADVSVPRPQPRGADQPRAKTPRTRQTALPVTPRDLPFMGALANQEWQTMAINEPYVPKIGTIFNGKLFGPDPYSIILAMSTPCGRGKSTATHGYLIDDLIQRKPGARVLLLSANILYGTSLSAELRAKYRGSAGIKVGFYRDERDEDLMRCNVVVCSLESLHRLGGQRFDAILIDEVRTIARLLGGATMTDFNNIYLLRELGVKAAEIIVCDADLMFKMDDSEPNTLAYDFMKLIFDKRPMLHASFPHPGPDHLRRKVVLLFDYGVKKKNPGKKAFFLKLDKAAAAWHKDKTKRFAVNGGSKTELSEIYNFLIGLKVPVKPYSGETNENAKFRDLVDDDSAWVAFGCIASTTSLSIGVDPKLIEFDRVFMWTHPMGCTLLAMFQAAMRFGRQALASAVR